VWEGDAVRLDDHAAGKLGDASAGVNGWVGVPAEVWEFEIGSYHVCEKWLKNRRGRTLSAREIVHFEQIVVAISETIRVMMEVDETIIGHGGWPAAFASAARAEVAT
jgi:hypothetical protein